MFWSCFQPTLAWKLILTPDILTGWCGMLITRLIINPDAPVTSTWLLRVFNWLWFVGYSTGKWYPEKNLGQQHNSGWKGTIIWQLTHENYDGILLFMVISSFNRSNKWEESNRDFQIDISNPRLSDLLPPVLNNFKMRTTSLCLFNLAKCIPFKLNLTTNNNNYPIRRLVLVQPKKYPISR